MGNVEQSDELSRSFKNEGNQCFAKQEFKNSMIFYNKALCYAKSDVESSLLYANRSAVFLKTEKYDECLENIQHAKKLGYPDDKMPKLLAREEECKLSMSAKLKNSVMDKNEKDVKNFLKLSYKSHPKIPFIIDAIELKRSEEFGRHLITTRDLKVGDIIAIEEPFMKMTKPFFDTKYQRCANCLRHNNLNLFPCEKCNNHMFCSLACLKERFHHHYEESIRSEDPKMEGIIYSELNVAVHKKSQLAFGDISTFEEILKERADKTVFDFDELTEKNKFIVFASMHMMKELEKFENPDCFDASKRIINILSSNGLGLAYDNTDNGKGGIFPGALGYCLFGSLFNHSCNPNVRKTCYDNKIVFYVGSPIKAGEQLFVWYENIFNFAYKTLPYRKNQMKLFVDFECKCEACVNDWPLYGNLPKKIKNYVPFHFAIFNSTKKIIEEFKKTCKKLESIWHLHPCYETVQTTNYMVQFMHLIRDQKNC